MSAGEASIRRNICNGTQSLCALCHECLKDVHSYPGQWQSDLQQFLLQYTTIPLSSCVCRANQVSLVKGLSLSRKLRDQFIPRWVKQELQK